MVIMKKKLKLKKVRRTRRGNMAFPPNILAQIKGAIIAPL